MKSRLLVTILPLLGFTSVALAAPKTKPVKVGSARPFTVSEDKLEARWSYRAQIDATKSGSAQWLLGNNEAKGVLVSLRHEAGSDVIVGQLSAPRLQSSSRRSYITFRDGGPTALNVFSMRAEKGELGLIWHDRTLSVLWNGRLMSSVQSPVNLLGLNFGTRTSGSWKLANQQMQPTEPVVFRDDFMRADGPDSPEVPSEWRVAGLWKTSMTLGPRADASLSPNPFVFRASGAGAHVARAGKWFWDNYSVSTSVRAMADDDDNEPLVAAIEAFSGPERGGVRGEVDFRTGVARLLINGITYASSKPFDASIGEWHRMRLEPKDGIVRLLFDGSEVVRAKCAMAQGEVALRAQTGKQNFVDFDDVRVGQAGAGDKTWGEGDLPGRLEKDRLMRNWANAASMWKRDAKGVWWHTGDFWSSANLEVPLPAFSKDGEGFRFYLGASTQNPPTAALVASVARKNGKIEARLNGKTTTLPLVAGAGNTVLLTMRSSANGNETGLSWNGNTLFSLPAHTRAGTKIGVEPTFNGAPLPVPSLQKLNLRATTFERDGHSVIGVNITPVSPQIARDMGLPDATGAVIDNVEDGSPASRAGFQNGDVVRAANGARVLDVDTMRRAVGGIRAPGVVMIDVLRAPGDGSSLDWAKCRATTENRLDYSFTSAPVDWKSARGQWEVAERWTCSPQWSFFAGQHDEFPLLWSRFAMRGDWTLEAYLATPMDLTRGERSPTDLNISVGDGHNISSGYSFAFAAQNREKNLIWRGHNIAFQKPFEMPAGSGETHQDWFYVRLERRETLRGVRFKWSVNGKPAGEYEDLNPLKNANRLAFWTKNGSLSIARVRLWHDGLLPMTLDPRPASVQKTVFSNGLDNFTPRLTGRNASAQLAMVKDGNDSAVEVSNPRDGGDWALYASRQPFEPSQKNRVLSFAYRAMPDVKVNLYALVANEWREIAWTGGVSKPEDNQPVLGAINGAVADNKWHTARFDLNAALQSNGLSGNKVEAIAFAAPSRAYLRQGLGGNVQGTKYWLRDFKTTD